MITSNLGTLVRLSKILTASSISSLQQPWLRNRRGSHAEPRKETEDTPEECRGAPDDLNQHRSRERILEQLR